MFVSTGGGVDIAFDREGLENYVRELNTGITTTDTSTDVRRKIKDSEIAKDTSKRCNLDVQFTSNGMIMILINSSFQLCNIII